MLHKLSFALLFAVLTCGQIASAETLRPGGCPDVEPLAGFIWPKFDGVWYEHSKYPTLREFGQKCINTNYTFMSNGTYAIKVSGINSSNRPFSSDIIGDIMQPGILRVTFPSATTRVDQIRGTDYTSWAVIYSCEKNGKNGLESAWILTRKRNADADAVRNAEKIMTNNNISTKGLQETIQLGCPAN